MDPLIDAEATLHKARARLTTAEGTDSDDPDWGEWLDHLRAQVTKAERGLRAVLRQLDLPTERAVLDAWRELDVAFALQSAEALVVSIRDAGGPTHLRVWSRPGHAPRVYFPGEVGYLTVNQDGSVEEVSRGRLTFVASGLYPAWKRAVRAGRVTYAQALGARLDAHGEARARVAARLRSGARPPTLAELLATSAQGSRSVTQAQRRRYETGLCAEFAVALHRVYGYPLAMWIEVEREGREWLEGPYVHVVAKHPSGGLLDVGGLSSKAALTRKLLHSPGTSLRFRDTTEQELDGFGMEGLDPETLADAEAIVRAYPGYGP